MQFGKLINLENIEFRLPSLTTDSIDYLQGRVQSKKLKIYVGAPAWGNPGWREKIYPLRIPSNEFLKYYSRSFNSIELNTTHYRIPSARDIEQWLGDVPVNFKFCPKFPQQISHYKGLVIKERVWEFINLIKLFKDALGPSFIQLHENFSPKSFGDLSKFINNLNGFNSVGVELRHKDWFIDQGIFRFLRSKEIPSVITDVAGRRDVLHMNITAPLAIVRFVGNNLHPTDYLRIDDWIKTILELNSLGLKELYFFVHQPEDSLCPEIADYLIKGLNVKGLSTSANINFVEKESLELF